MTIEQFITENIGKFVEYDGVYNYQCVDLVKKYNRDVIGGAELSGNAKDYARNQRPESYELHKNTPFYIPPRGAIAVWNGNVGGGLGHVSIVMNAQLMSFVSLDQNWPAKSRVVYVEHTYKNVECFLVPRKENLNNSYNMLLTELQNLVSKYPKAG